MTKTVAVYYPDMNPEHAATLTAFYIGVKKFHPGAKLLPLDHYDEPVDIAVVFGVGKIGMPISYPRAKVIKGQEEAGKQVIVLEKGYVKRDEYYAAGFGGLNGRADFRNEHMPPDRWEQLGVNLEPWQHNPEGHVIVCGQVPTDASVQHININEWCAEMINAITVTYFMDAIYRPHPLAYDRVPKLEGAFNSHRPFETDLKNARAVMTFNSNAAVEAAIAGIPVFAFDTGSMAMPIANQRLSLIRQPQTPVREQWASDLAYAQWTRNEMEEGNPWLHLTRSD